MNWIRAISRKRRVWLSGGLLVTTMGMILFSFGIFPTGKFAWITLEQRIKMDRLSKLRFAELCVENRVPKMSRWLHGLFWKPVPFQSFVFEAPPEWSKRLQLQNPIPGTNGTRAWIISKKDFDTCANVVAHDNGVVICASPRAITSSGMPGVVISYPGENAISPGSSKLPEHQISIYLEIKPELGLRSTTLVGGFMAKHRTNRNNGFTEIDGLRGDFLATLKKGDALLVDTNLKRAGCTNDTWFLLTPELPRVNNTN